MNIKNDVWYGHKIANPDKPISVFGPGGFYDLVCKVPKCIVREIDSDLQKELQDYGIKSIIGQFVVAYRNINTAIKFLGPFNNIEKSFDVARKKLKVNKFINKSAFQDNF